MQFWQLFDEGLYLKNAAKMVAHFGTAQWLGPFDALMLSKAPGFSVFLALSVGLDIPYRLAEFLLFCPLPFIFFVAVRPLNLPKWSADTIISTIPWRLWNSFCTVPVEIQHEISNLVSIPIDIDYVADTLDNDSHWIYEPDESIAHHRLLLRSNFGPALKITEPRQMRRDLKLRKVCATTTNMSTL